MTLQESIDIAKRQAARSGLMQLVVWEPRAGTADAGGFHAVDVAAREALYREAAVIARVDPDTRVIPINAPRIAA